MFVNHVKIENFDQFYFAWEFFKALNIHMKSNTQKSNKRSMAETIEEETNRGGQRKAKRLTTQRNKEKRKELMPIMGIYVVNWDFKK